MELRIDGTAVIIKSGSEGAMNVKVRNKDMGVCRRICQLIEALPYWCDTTTTAHWLVAKLELSSEDEVISALEQAGIAFERVREVPWG